MMMIVIIVTSMIKLSGWDDNKYHYEAKNHGMKKIEIEISDQQMAGWRDKLAEGDARTHL